MSHYDVIVSVFGAIALLTGGTLVLGIFTGIMAKVFWYGIKLVWDR